VGRRVGTNGLERFIM